jgi:predicted AlkP superfamily pyrophosphatase or phosphodiesterase
MIRFVCRLVLLALVCSFPLAAGAAPRAEHVFIVSIDGGSPAVIKQSQMPVLAKLAKQGACTWTAQTVKPFITLPAHTSMLTGVGPDKHRIQWNSWVPTNGVVTVPTVFAAAKAAGFSTAMFVGKEKFRHLRQPGTVDEFSFNRAAAQAMPETENGTNGMTAEDNTFARAVAANAAEYIVKAKPALCFIHFTDPDSFGHKYGWGSPEQIKAFADVDAALGAVVKAIRQAGLEERSVLIITADHGGHKKSHGQNIPADVQIPWIAWGKGVKSHYEITVPVNICDTAATVLWLLDLPRPATLDGTPVVSAFE